MAAHPVVCFNPLYAQIAQTGTDVLAAGGDANDREALEIRRLFRDELLGTGPIGAASYRPTTVEEVDVRGNGRSVSAAEMAREVAVKRREARTANSPPKAAAVFDRKTGKGFQHIPRGRLELDEPPSVTGSESEDIGKNVEREDADASAAAFHQNFNFIHTNAANAGPSAVLTGLLPEFGGKKPAYQYTAATAPEEDSKKEDGVGKFEALLTGGVANASQQTGGGEHSAHLSSKEVKAQQQATAPHYQTEEYQELAKTTRMKLLREALCKMEDMTEAGSCPECGCLVRSEPLGAVESDTESVHNESDLTRIKQLEAQLAESKYQCDELKAEIRVQKAEMKDMEEQVVTQKNEIRTLQREVDKKNEMLVNV
eukprot:GSA25T00006173001.1